MESSPDRPVQFRNDLDALYGLVGELQTTVRGIATTQEQHGLRLGRVERGVTELRGDVIELKHAVAELGAGQDELRGDVAELRADVTEVRGDVTGLKQAVGELRSGQDGLRGDVAELRGGQDEILRLLRARP
jgi:predicted nuclease with TOPRIM domain